MPAIATKYAHVELDARGVPIIAGTTMKVIELVIERIAYGWSPEELQFQHPYLTLGQVHSALAYYEDHKEELDDDIERREQEAEQLRVEMGQPHLVQRLKAQGLI